MSPTLFGKLQILDESVAIRIFLQIAYIHPPSSAILVVLIRVLLVVSDKKTTQSSFSENNFLNRIKKTWLLT